jgi:hypothetical protein
VAKNPEWFPKLQAEIDVLKKRRWPPTWYSGKPVVVEIAIVLLRQPGV